MESQPQNTEFRNNPENFTYGIISQIYDNKMTSFLSKIGILSFLAHQGEWWLSGRVLDLRPEGRWLETNKRHCIASLIKTLYPLVSTGSTQEDRKLS